MKLKRYIENIIHSVDKRDQDAADCAIHMGWHVPLYTNLADDINELQRRMPKLRERFIQEANAMEFALDEISQSGLMEEMLK